MEHLSWNIHTARPCLGRKLPPWSAALSIFHTGSKPLHASPTSHRLALSHSTPHIASANQAQCPCKCYRT
eukprot:5962459-Amphidinium_carterae.1